MPQQVFGAGFLEIGTPSGPMMVGALQDVSFSKKGTTKGLYGSQKVAVGMSEGEVKITGKAKSAVFSGPLIAALIAGMTLTTGYQAGVLQETATLVTDATDFNASCQKATVAQAATFISDLSVFDLTALTYLTPVTLNMGSSNAPPLAGTYQVNPATGIYYLNSGVAGHTLLISYDYGVTATGHTGTYVNGPMGSVVVCSLKLYNTYAPTAGAKNMGLYVPACNFPDIDIALKNTDWIGKDITFEAWDPSPVGSGTVFKFFGGE